MIFFKVGIFFLLVHGTVCCEKNLDCEGCLQKSCRFIVTTEKDTVCVEKDDNVSVLKEIKKIRFCKFVDLYTNGKENAPSAPNEVLLNKAIHTAKMKDVTRATTVVPVEYSTDVTTMLPYSPEIESTISPDPDITVQPVPQDKTDAQLNLQIHAAKIRDAIRGTTVPSIEYPAELIPPKFPIEETTISPKSTTTMQAVITSAPPQPPVPEAPTTTLASEAAAEDFQTVTEASTLQPLIIEETTELAETTNAPTSEMSTSEKDTMTTEDFQTAASVTLESVQQTTKPTNQTEKVQMVTEPTTQKMQVPDGTTKKDFGETSDLCKSETELKGEEDHQRDSDVILSDVEELFMSFKLFFKCEKGPRNESLMFAYVSSLCSIAKLSEQIGIQKFSDRDQAWFMANRARRFDATCSAVRYIKKKCRVPSPPKIRVLKKGLIHGQRSPLFDRVYSSSRCDKKADREDILSKLARITCYSGEIFLELYRLVELNAYDVSYGLGNPSYRHPSACISLFFKKRHCFNKECSLKNL